MSVWLEPETVAALGEPECEPMIAGEDGWSEWIHPLPGYLMQCCDCGLIHEMEFAIGQTNEPASALNEGETKRRLILFRARRHPATPKERK